MAEWGLIHFTFILTALTWLHRPIAGQSEKEVTWLYNTKRLSTVAICDIYLDNQPCHKVLLWRTRGRFLFPHRKMSHAGRQRTQQHKLNTSLLSASPPRYKSKHSTTTSYRLTLLSYQTCSFTFFPSTSMVFTLKSMPGRQQGDGKEQRRGVSRMGEQTMS